MRQPKSRVRGKVAAKSKGRGGGKSTVKGTAKGKDNNIFHNVDWCKFAVSEVLEDGGEWRRCTLYHLNSSKSDVCVCVCVCVFVCFGDDECEGLPPHSCSVSRNTNILNDSDGDEFNTRNFIIVYDV